MRRRENERVSITLLAEKIAQDSEGRVGRLNEEGLLNCYMALGRTLEKSGENLGWNPGHVWFWASHSTSLSLSFFSWSCDKDQRSWFTESALKQCLM